MRMLGMFHEANDDVVKAQEIYLDLFEQNVADTQTIKRLVALYRDMEMYPMAITILNKFIETNQEDTEAWHELADLYLSKQNFSKALYCYEEILAHQPHNYLVTLRYAEILYSSNRSDRLNDLENARKYFAHAAVLKTGGAEEPCVRALFGVIRSCKQIEKMAKRDDPKNGEIMQTAQLNLQTYYQTKKNACKGELIASKLPCLQV